MNRNHHLSEKTYGPRHVQPHNPKGYATKKKKISSNNLKREIAAAKMK